MSFDFEKMNFARNQTISSVHEISTLIEIGMNIEDGLEVINQVLKKRGSQKNWHPHKLRIGTDTLKTFRLPPDPKITLKEQDIFFIDIGPIFDGYEADYGETFTKGQREDLYDLSQVSKRIFTDVKKKWIEKKLTGAELYSFASERAKIYEVNLDTTMKGHFLEEFPHSLVSREKLIERNIETDPNLWVLEILIQNKEKTLGSFFEDVLL